MKKIYTLFVALLITGSLMAQAPQSFNYQAVVRDAEGHIIVNTQVGMKISIVQGSIDGTTVCVEEFTPTTNDFGLVTLAIGSMNIIDFAAIDWSAGPFFVKAELDPAGGTTYTEMGTSQLLSVPYALYAKTAETADYTESDPVFSASVVSGITGPDTAYWNNKSDFPVDYNYLTNKPDLTVYATKDMGNQNITNLADPINDQDAATKAYVDNLLSIIQTIQTGIRDADGNTYDVILIGNQLWMAENLKTTKYNDGTAIPLVTDGADWSVLTTPGYCWYNNDSATYENLYGKLYNWYTVNTGKLCPDGWHVSTDAEWTTLTSYLGGASVAGGKLKETGTVHWKSPNTGATNETGFTAFPGGYRENNGLFSGIGDNGYWWSSTEGDAGTAWSRHMNYSSSNVYRGSYNKKMGYSVRCVRD